MKILPLAIVLLAAFGADPEITIHDAEDPGARPYKLGRILFKESFNDLKNWKVEQQPGGTAKVENNALVIDDKKGCTIWLRDKFAAPILIEYEATISSDARVSDLNCFWMANDHGAFPGDAEPPRQGQFKQYDILSLYYVGCGGHNNAKTRFRRYLGTGDKPLLPQHDYDDPAHLLTPDKPTKIQIAVFENRTQYFRDGVCYYDIVDEKPLTEGWFGFRLVNSKQRFRNFTVHALDLNSE